MKYILALILLTCTTALAEEPNGFADIDTKHIEQQIMVKSPEEQNASFVISLVNDGDNNYRLVVYLQKSASAKKLYDLPNFWKGATAFSGRAEYPASIMLAPIDSGFTVTVRDTSSEAKNMDLVFYWQHGKFRLIREKKSSNPKVYVKPKNGETVAGRWTCSLDTDLLNGYVTEKSVRGRRNYHVDIIPKYLDDYAIEPNYADKICR